MATKKRAEAPKPAQKTGAEEGNRYAERLRLAAEQIRLGAAVNRIANLESRLGTAEDHEARLTAIDAVLRGHGYRLARIEARGIENTLRGRLRWLFRGR